MSLRRPSACVALALLLFACGDDSVPPGDLHPGQELGVDVGPDPDQGPGPDSLQPGDGPATDGLLTDGQGTDGPGGDGPQAGDAGDGPQTGDAGDGPQAGDAGDGPQSGDGLTGDALPSPDTGPSLSCVSVTPQAGNNAAAVVLTLDGYYFLTGATVELLDLVTGAVSQLGTPTLSDTNSDTINDRAVISVPAGTSQGTYSVWIKNPGSGDQVTCGTYTSTTELAPTVTDVVPDTAWQGDPNDLLLSDQPITVKGTGFKPTPTVRFVSVATKQIYQAPTVGYISDTGLTSICPSESLAMPVGDYHVEVTNPSQLWARWMVAGQPGVFKVTATPPPSIDTVLPYRVAVNAGGGVPAVQVVITGDFFHQNSKVILLLPGGATLDLTAYITAVQISPTGKDSITFSLDNTQLNLVVGIYPLRVVNPDAQYDTYFSLQIEHAALGKLNSDTWKVVSALTYPRERHASVEGFDVFGGSYLYTVGGTSLPAGGSTSTRPRPVLANVEFTEVDVFGIASASSTVAMQLDPTVNLATLNPKHGVLRKQTLMASPRTGLTLVRAGRYLYAVGGATSDTWYPAVAGLVGALKTVERALILGYETRPNLSFPSAAPVSKGLPVGTWYYRVSAVTTEGESLPSREVAAMGAGGKITLKWLPVTGASSYLVYRSPASDGRPGSSRLIKANVAGTSFSDDGQGELTPAPGRLRAKVLAGGSLAVGTWSYRVSAVPSAAGTTETVAGYRLDVTTAAGNQTIKLAWDPIPGATYSLYRSSTAGGGATYLLAAGIATTSFTDSGGTVDTNTPAPDGIASLPAGALSRWSTLSSQLNTGREGADAVVIKAVDGNLATTDEPTYIFVVGGRQDNSTNTDYLRSTERALLDPATGTLGSFTVMQATAGGPQLLNAPRAFFPLLSTQGRNETPVAPPPVAPPCPDNDGDSYTSCACGGTDCNDGDPTIYPGAPEICGDGIDQNCDQGCAGGSDLACNDCSVPDADGDSYNRPQCGGTDCNDGDPTIYPGAPEICGDGIDQDCDGKDTSCACPVPDADNDGFDSIPCGGNDCNDNDPSICPDLLKCPEIPCDGIDQNCDGFDPCSPPEISSYSFSTFKLPAFGVSVVGGPAGSTPKMLALDSGRVKQCTAYFSGGMGSLLAQNEEPVHLVALYGDPSYTYPQKNIGSQTAEVALVLQTGELTPWTMQNDQISGNSRYGNDGLLYHDFAFSFLGVLNEDLGQDPPGNQIWNNVYRYEIDTTAAGQWTNPPPATFLYNLNPAASYLNVARGYLSVVRLNAFIFGIAGNAGAGVGPIDSIERIKQ